ncbi:MAG: tetratricopeptide repeat protein [Acidobacteriota bacterium]
MHSGILMRGSVAALLLLASAPLLCQTPVPAVAKVPELESRAAQYLQAQKPKLAIPLLREIVAIEPSNVNARANLGVLLYFDGNNAEAIPHLRAALKLQPDLSRIQALLGLAERRTGDIAAAQSDLTAALPNLTDEKIRIQAGLELIELLQAAGELNKAQSVAGRLRESDPTNPRVLFVNHEIASQIMDETLLSLMVAAPDSAESHMAIAGELTRQGDRVNAIAQLREAIRLNPAVPGGHYQLGEQLRTATDAALNAHAEAEYKAAVRTNPNDELAWRQLAGVLSAKGDLKAAEEDYRKALALNPADADAETGLAIVLISQKRNAEATALLESAVQHDPTNLVAHFRLSSFYRMAGREADADREMASFRHYQEIRNKLGKTFRQTGPAPPQ